MMATTSNARQLVFRLGDSARLPDALLGVLRDEVVLAGWMRASGVLHEVQLRTFGASGAAVRTLAGTAHVIVLDGSIGMSQGDVTCGLRAVLARETETGLETIAGEIVAARIGGLEVMVTALDELSATRQEGPAGVWLLDASATAAAPVRSEPRAVAPVASPPEPARSSGALPPDRASEPEVTKPTGAPKPSPAFGASAAIPQRPMKPVVEEAETLCPDPGDIVEHFAFGRCEVVKSDGDRLHLRLGKDGRLKEIALEMLKVTSLPDVEGQPGKHYRLDRKL
jgi:predicted DNA-binding protein with PD1-like motif